MAGKFGLNFWLDKKYSQSRHSSCVNFTFFTKFLNQFFKENEELVDFLLKFNQKRASTLVSSHGCAMKMLEYGMWNSNYFDKFQVKILTVF